MNDLEKSKIHCLFQINKIEGSISSANCNKSNTSSDRNQVQCSY